MIAYFPEIYHDELFYSLIARYYSHLYPSYNMAIEDLCKTKTSRIDMEFGLQSLNSDTKNFLEQVYGLKNILLHNTMFPQYAKFETVERRDLAAQVMFTGEGDIHSALIFPKNKSGSRYLRYCPLCFEKDRNEFGEAYWHRTHQIRGINVCSTHGCYLHDSDIEINSKSSPRLWVADDIVVDSSVNYASDKEIQFTDYVVKIIQSPIPRDQPQISDWLISKLEGTEYITTRGKRKYVTKLHSDMQEYYKQFGLSGIEQQYQVVKLFTGDNNNFLDICKLAFFLNIPIEEITDPRIPEKSQTERFDEKVNQLYQEGLGCHRIAQKVGSCPSTALKANRIKEKAPHDYAVRKGIAKKNWNAMDVEMLSKVKELCEKIYIGGDDRPKRVTAFAITKAMSWPDKRLDYLPRCKELVQRYSMESMEEYWARECVFFYKILLEESTTITWRNLRDKTNLTRKNFERCKKYLSNYTDKVMAEMIRKLI